MSEKNKRRKRRCKIDQRRGERGKKDILEGGDGR